MFGKKSFTILPNVIDSERVQFDAEERCVQRKCMCVQQKRVVISVGRTAVEKNPFFAIDVVIAAHQRNELIEYWWVGSGPLDRQLADYIADHHAESYIRLLGSRNDVADLYQAADIFFLPSLFEGLPLTGIEAQAMGLPCVVSDTITQEMVYTDLVRYLSLDDGADRWADVLLEAIEITPDRYAYHNALLRSPFSGARAGERLLQYYQSICESRR